MTLDEDSLKLDQIRRNFSRHTAEYDRYALVQKRVAKKMLQRLPLAFAKGRALEVGCGTGMLSGLFQQQHPEVQLILSDIAHGMSCRVANDYPGRPVVDADAAALPFATNSLDLVLSSSVYQWVTPLPQAFFELQRILRPGGAVIMALFGDRTLFELRHSHVVALGGGQSHVQGFPDRQQIQKVLKGRFRIDLLESCEEVEWHAGVPQLLRSLKAIGAQNASSQRPSGLTSPQLMQRMYRCYSSRFGVGGKIPATYEVIYMLASRL